MGFGYLFFGYLIAFLLSLTAKALGFGSLALILGIGLMYLGLSRLCKYHKSFALSLWLLLPMLLVSVYGLVSEISATFLLGIPFTTGTVQTVVSWIDLGLTVLYQCALLYAIRMLAGSIELTRIARSALRNTLFVGIYAVLMIARNLSTLSEVLVGYLNLFANVFQLLWIVCILWLLVNCMKCIGSAEEENEEPTRSRVGWINRINDAYDRTHNRLNEQARADGEEFMRRRREKKNKKSKKKK